MGMQFLRGLQGGSASFGIYGVGLVLEGASRLAFVAVAVMLLPNSPLLVGAGLAGSFFVVWFLGPRTLAAPRAETVSESSGGGVWLLLFASLVESFILNVGPIVVGIASAAPEQAGRFLNGVVVARLPLMAFVAIKASLLPELTVLARRNQVGIIRQRMGHIVRLVVVVAAFTSVVVSLVGPIIVRILFGDEIGRFDFFLLAASNCGIMVPLTFSIGLAAMGRDRQLATGWALSVVAFTLCMFLPLRPFLLVEVALAVAVGVASLSMALFVRAATREPAVHDRDKRRRNVAPSSLVRADSNH